MSQHCKANPCCGDRPCSGVPLPQHTSGLTHHNKKPEATEDMVPRSELDRLESLHRSEIAEMAERFRSVNVAEAMRQLAPALATEGGAHEKGIEVAVDAFQEMTGGFDDDAHIIRKVIRAYLDEVERSTPRYRHKKRGTVYDVITSTARLQTSGKLEDNEVMWVYRGSDGQVWVRSDMEFMDGRFELVAALTAKQTDGREE